MWAAERRRCHWAARAASCVRTQGHRAAIADQVVLACRRAGVGSTVTLQIGAETDEHTAYPSRSPERCAASAMASSHRNPHSHLASMVGTTAQMGHCAVVVNDRAILLSEHKVLPPMDLGQFHSQGLRPEVADYVVVKAAVSHKAAYDPITGPASMSTHPGCAPATCGGCPSPSWATR